MTDMESVIAQLGVPAVVDQSRLAYFDEALSTLTTAGRRHDLVDERQPDLATALERLALSTQDPAERKRHADAAFLCRRSAPARGTGTGRLLELFYLCVDGLLAERHAELAMLLREELLDAETVPADADWPNELFHRVARAFVLLCRKGGGWADVRAASAEVHSLRQLQELRERTHFEAQGAHTAELARVIALYNLAKVVDLTASFLIEGSPSDPLMQVDRHASQAARAAELDDQHALTMFTDALHAGAIALVRTSIWFNTRQLGARFRAFVDEIAGDHRTAPILELWPSQREALSANLLNPAKRAIVVEMPTSAGKTLIAEFAIVQALALDPDARVVYLVPTRALVNQITARLRRDFGPLGYQVEAAIPVFEIDPTEDALLRQPVDILVLTPEKLDLLLRVDHPVVGAISLVVADEAHNISGGDRGARLELLLGIIRREKPSSRFLLLTPFVPNGEELAAWLGEDVDGRIEVSWKPSERVAAAAHWKRRRKGPYELKFTTLPSATSVDLQTEVEFGVGEVPGGLTRTKKGIAVSAALVLAQKGGVLLLERGRKYAEDRAREIGELLPSTTPDEFTQAVINFTRAELSDAHPLPALFEKGVTFHHAGLSHDVRLLVELLIDRGSVKVVAGTTTLAQGVNFPIASVIVSSLQKYVGPPKQWDNLSYAEFWNIAGRAGRAMRDRLGLVVFPVRDPADMMAARNFLQGEAAELSSVLLEALGQIGDAVETFDLQFVTRNPAMSVFLQYLTHALRIAGHEAASAEIEDILRSSFVYSQARQHNRALAERLVDISRRYLDHIRGKPSGYLALADGTGFSLATIDMLYAVHREEHREFSDAAFWSTDRLFTGDLTDLTSVISLLGRVPELDLGRGDVGPFNPALVAGVLSDWVRGDAIQDIADRRFTYLDDPVDRLRAASHYLHSNLVAQVPWGMGVIQRLALDRETAESVGHIPSLVFYGVPTKEAAELRMASVPRVAAEGLARRWRETGATASSFAAVRSWIAGTSIEDWDQALPPQSPISGVECRRIWTALAGVD